MRCTSSESLKMLVNLKNVMNMKRYAVGVMDEVGEVYEKRQQEQQNRTGRTVAQVTSESKVFEKFVKIFIIHSFCHFQGLHQFGQNFHAHFHPQTIVIQSDSIRHYGFGGKKHKKMAVFDRKIKRICAKTIG